MGISVKTVHRWDEAGKLHTVRTTENQRRIPIEELVQDLLSIVTVFAGRLYGHHAKGLQNRIETVLKECEAELRERYGTNQQDHQSAP